MPTKQPTLITHHPVNPFVVDPVMPVQSQASPDTAAAVSGAILDHIGNGLLDDDFIAARGRLSQDVSFGRAISHGQHMAARHAKGTADGSHCSPPGNTGKRAIHFFALAKSTAS